MNQSDEVAAQTQLSQFAKMETHAMKALFLDRDGVINKRLVGEYVRSPQEFEFIVDIFDLLQLARSRGYLLILISNQQGVGKGLMSMQELDIVHHHMQRQLLDRLGYNLDDLYVCTDLDGSQSPRRKPEPGMLFEAIAKYDLTPNQCWFVGDSITDAMAGRSAGVHSVLIGDFLPTDATLVVENHTEATRVLSGLL